PWAQDFVRIVRREGGAATLEDLANYRPRWAEPISVHFGDASVSAPDSAAGCTAVEALNLIDAQGLEGANQLSTDPAAFVRTVKAVGFARSGPYLPQVQAFEHAHGIADGCRSRLTKTYAATVAPALDALMASPSPGGEPGHHSASLIVVDRWGN